MLSEKPSIMIFGGIIAPQGIKTIFASSHWSFISQQNLFCLFHTICLSSYRACGINAFNGCGFISHWTDRVVGGCFFESDSQYTQNFGCIQFSIFWWGKTQNQRHCETDTFSRSQRNVCFAGKALTKPNNLLLNLYHTVINELKNNAVRSLKT